MESDVATFIPHFIRSHIERIKRDGYKTKVVFCQKCDDQGCLHAVAWRSETDQWLSMRYGCTCENADNKGWGYLKKYTEVESNILRRIAEDFSVVKDKDTGKLKWFTTTQASYVEESMNEIYLQSSSYKDLGRDPTVEGVVEYLSRTWLDYYEHRITFQELEPLLGPQSCVPGKRGKQVL